MSERVDLDKLEALSRKGYEWESDYIAALVEAFPALAAELRAARRVVEACEDFFGELAPFTASPKLKALDDALVNYRAALGGAGAP